MTRFKRKPMKGTRLAPLAIFALAAATAAEAREIHLDCTRTGQTVMIDVDHADVRKFSEQSAYLRLEALLENIEAGRVG